MAQTLEQYLASKGHTAGKRGRKAGQLTESVSKRFGMLNSLAEKAESVTVEKLGKVSVFSFIPSAIGVDGSFTGFSSTLKSWADSTSRNLVKVTLDHDAEKSVTKVYVVLGMTKPATKASK